MKKLLLSTAMLAALTLPAFAQANTPFRAMTDMDAQIGSVHGSDLIGARVYARDGAVDMTEVAGIQTDWADIGEVNDIVLSREGQVQAVLVDVGGFLGMGERQVAVDMTALRFVSDSSTDPDDWFLVMTGNRALIEGAPEWSMASATGAMTGAATTTAASQAATNQTGTNQTGTNQTTSNQSGQMGQQREPMMRDGYAAATTEALTAENLLGANVYDSADNDVGTVQDLVIAEDGTITQIVLDIGGFLGIGAKPVALEMNQVDILQATDGGAIRIHVPMTRDQLDALPNYEG